MALGEGLVEFGYVVQDFYHEDDVECFVFDGDFSCVRLDDVDVFVFEFQPLESVGIDVYAD